MPRLIECLISIDLANALRALLNAMKLKVPEGNIKFRCPKCRKPVRAHRSRGGKAAHFEHLKKNSKCPHSHTYRGDD